ncbi:hypothetical protein HID58_076546 [Brassica napus]|uniref:Uncharacterized protein n=1 Tax=Brassica napus TaxID=3708 RepID=A0ABQ7YMT0_BRANA|nr:hypothetical protein HID58_076546 [Brassica napus]
MIEAQGLVLVKLNIEFSLSFSYTCILAFLVGYMNIAMEQTEEYVNGQFKNKYGADELMERGSFCSSDTRSWNNNWSRSVYSSGNIAAALSACCYAELASCCSSAGSAYYYAYILLEKDMY